MDWSGISSKSLVGKLLRMPLRLLPANTTMPILQGRMKGKRWLIGSSNHGCWLGSYENDKQRLLERTIVRGSTVFDLGGHVGFYTLLASELVGDTGKVFVFEPLPGNLAVLRRHLSLNHVNNVTVIDAAVSDRSGVALFHESPSSYMGRVASDGQLRVRAVSLDELIATGGLPTPDCIKIDIEGAEALALSGARAMLAKSHPTIFLATHGRSVHQECCEMLRSVGYQLTPIDGAALQETSEILATFGA